MKLQPDPLPQPPHALLTRLAAISPKLCALADWLDVAPEDEQLRRIFCFTPEDQERAKERDLADRRALAGRDVIAREPEAFELFGRSRASWADDVRGGGLYSATNEDAPPSDGSAYVVLVVRLDRAGRKLAKLLCPRFEANGTIPADEAGAMGWALIPHVEWWGTRCDAEPAKQVSAAGARYLGDGFDEGAAN